MCCLTGLVQTFSFADREVIKTKHMAAANMVAATAEMAAAEMAAAGDVRARSAPYV